MTTIARTAQGRVEGRQKNDVLLFAGIPYAAPPVGPLRFRAAQSHEPWSETRPSKRFGPASPQNPGTGLTGVANTRWDEDCLTLNISTPALDDARRPVLVWIHGGGYRTGQGAIPWYDGSKFARNSDIVVISINYRLGALGFAHLARFGDEFASSGANGTLDQIFALEWVRDNIASFGGDPENVTIAGESAGGFSIGTLLGNQRATGLFKRAIAQSGAAHHTLPVSASEKVTDLFCDLLSIRSAADLKRLTVPEILDAQAKIDKEMNEGIGRTNALGVAVAPLYPTVDGRVIDRDPLEAIRSGLNSEVPVLIGTNSDEATLFGFGELDETKLSRMVAGLGGSDELLDAYRQSRPGASGGELAVAVSSDHMFRIPAIRLAEARFPQSSTTHMYLFDWKSRGFGGKLGATHALEIPFVFDNLDRAGVGAFLGEGPQPQHVADAMHAAWVSFIRNGDPNHEGIPNWPAYDAAERSTLVFGDESELHSDPFAAERRCWHGLR